MKTTIATTKEQSGRLIACGVSIDTADMMFTPHNTLSTEPYKSVLKNRDYSPAWSLSALCWLLPKEIEVDESPYDEVQKYGLLIYPFMDGWQVDYQYCEDDECHCLKCVHGADLIEACVQLIEWLTANGYKLHDPDCPCRKKGGTSHDDD